MGLISADRGSKATLLLTIPGFIAKSYASVSKRFHLTNTIHAVPIQHVCRTRTHTTNHKSYSPLNRTTHILYSTDSNLEAFSCYLTYDSIAALRARATATTNYMAQWFLSY